MVKKFAITMVAAMSKNRVIGDGGKIPWDLPDDRIFFRHATLGKVMIVGRSTFDAIGRLLPDRIHIILTKNRSLKVPGAIVTYSPEEALAVAKDESNAIHEDEIIIAGGGKVYEAFLPEATRLHLTVVDANLEGDAFFPEFDETKWDETSREHHAKDADHDFAFDIITYDRRI